MVDRREIGSPREMPQSTPDVVAPIVWLTGLSGAGKTTLGRALRDIFLDRGWKSELLDGDAVREAFGSDLGFSRQDRDRNVARLGFVASLLAKHGVTVIVAAVSPFREARAKVRALHGGPFIEVFVDCPLSVLEVRDTKGLYRKAREGLIQQMTGVSDPYEPPLSPECHVRTDQMSLDECVHLVFRAIGDRRASPAHPNARTHASSR